VPVFGVGEDDGLHYYVMQFIAGQGLDQVLAELRRLRKTRGGGASAGNQTPSSFGVTLTAADMAQRLLTGYSSRTEKNSALRSLPRSLKKPLR